MADNVSESRKGTYRIILSLDQIAELEVKYLRLNFKKNNVKTAL